MSNTRCSAAPHIETLDGPGVPVRDVRRTTSLGKKKRSTRGSNAISLDMSVRQSCVGCRDRGLCWMRTPPAPESWYAWRSWMAKRCCGSPSHRVRQWVWAQRSPISTMALAGATSADTSLRRPSCCHPVHRSCSMHSCSRVSRAPSRALRRRRIWNSSSNTLIGGGDV